MSQDAKAPTGVILYGILLLIVALVALVTGFQSPKAGTGSDAEPTAAAGADEVAATEGPGVLRVLLYTLEALFIAATALALMKLRAWAWFVVTIGFLVSSFVNLVGVILSLAEGRSMLGPLFFAVFAAFSLWYLGRYSMECRFRPHILEAEGTH